MYMVIVIVCVYAMPESCVMCALISKNTGRSWFAIDVLRSARQETWHAHLSGIHPSKSLWEEPLSSLYGENWKVVNLSLCLSIWVDVSEEVIVCQFFIAGRKCISRPYFRCQPCICHIYGLTPYVEFLSSRSNYDPYLAKDPLRMLTDRMQELCTTASCTQGHVFWTFDYSYICDLTGADCWDAT